MVDTNIPMSNAMKPTPSNEEIMAKLKEYIEQNSFLKEIQHPVSHLVGWVIMHYRGTLNPIKIRSMAIVAFYGKDASRFILNNARNDILALQEFNEKDSESYNHVAYILEYLDDWIAMT